MDVQALCDSLLANEAALAELEIDLDVVNDAELKLILEAAKKNKTLKKVSVTDSGEGGEGRPLSIHVTLSLASVVSEHPQIQEIELMHVSLIEFGPIALAIQQNRKLNRLVLYDCWITQNILECIQWLLTENALECMTLLDNFSRDREASFDISGPLLGNTSLKELLLHDPCDDFGLETFQAIPQLIQKNRDFETIDLSISKDEPEGFEIVRLVTQAVEGHASLNKLAITFYPNGLEVGTAHDVGSAEAIGTMLQNAPALRELSLSGCYMGSEGARYLADGLSSKNSVVENVDLSDNKLGDDEVGIFARVLIANQNLKSLGLSKNNIGDPGALEIAVALRQNNTLDLLDLDCNYYIGSDGANAIADALVANTALKDLNLSCCIVGDDGATSIAEMLTRNESVEKICIGGFGEEGLKGFATRLSSMNGLKSLKIRSTCYTSEIGNSFVLALEQNTPLETFDFFDLQYDVEVMPQVTRLLALNRGGRRLLSAMGESFLPLNYWPRILARSSNNADVIFNFLREIPNVLVEKAGSRKRKRGHHE